MRASVLVLAIVGCGVGCGPVLLGEEGDDGSQEDGARALDGALRSVGSDAALDGRARSEDASVERDAGPPLLCLRNGSFEGTPAFNSGVPNTFEAAPWSVCGGPLGAANTPDVASDSIPQMLVQMVPKASDGQAYLGMTEQEQASQQLCEDIAGGTTRSLRLDLARIHVAGELVADTEVVFVELWGGIATDCSQRELLWASPALTDDWRSYCVTLRPQHYTDNLTLRARSDNSLPTAVYAIVDHLVPVASCP